MKPRCLISVLTALFVVLPATPPSALAISSYVVHVADGSVVAVRDPSGVRTGFAFGSAGLVVAGASADMGVQLITAHGLSTVGAYAARDGELAILHAAGLQLLPLRGSAVREIRFATQGYVLGAPLGYEGRRIRMVRLPEITLHNARTVHVAGHLAASFQGAPVVTRGGRVIGAVAGVGATSWTLAPASRLSALVATATETGGGEGFPLISIPVGMLVVIVGLGGLVAMRSRRGRAGTGRSPIVLDQRPMRRPTREPIEDPSRRATQPLVRRRGPDIGHGDDEDFDVVIKSLEDR